MARAGGRAAAAAGAEPAPPPPEGSPSRRRDDAGGAGVRRAGRPGSGRRSVRARAGGRGGRGERPVPAEAPLAGRRPLAFRAASPPRALGPWRRTVPGKGLATRMAPSLTLLLQPRPFYFFPVLLHSVRSSEALCGDGGKAGSGGPRAAFACCVCVL